MTLTLYTAQGTCALASHIALEEAGAEYELQRLDFSKTEQLSPEYLSINPKARVPTLITPRGILTETPAILAFIAQAFPSADLAAQNDPFAFAEVQDFNSYLCSTVHVAHAHRRRGHRWADNSAAIEAMKKKVRSQSARVSISSSARCSRDHGSWATVTPLPTPIYSRWLSGWKAMASTWTAFRTCWITVIA